MIHRRRQLFVQPRVQGRLILRVLLYVALAAFLSGWVASRTESGPDAGWTSLFASLAVFMALAPVVIFDLARWSNRVFGPMTRAQGALRRAAGGHRLRPLKFREGEPWEAWLRDFNAAMTRSGQVRNGGEALPPWGIRDHG